MRVRPISTVVMAAVAFSVSSLAAPVLASFDGAIPSYSDAEFVGLIEEAFTELPGLLPPVAQSSITGNRTLDAKLWTAAFARGYEMRHVAVESNLVWRDGLRMQPLAAEAWTELKAAALDAGHRLWVKSAYRSPSDQRSIFRERLNGSSTNAIDSTLAYHSLPGTSRHHSGYTIDITLPGRQLWQFRGTAAHTWLTADNYANAKRFGFVPSYPPESPPQGPNPEPWEFVFIGIERIMGYEVLMGDWDGDGVETQGVFAKGEWRLDSSVFNFGAPGDIPLVGDWDGDGSDTPAVFDGASITFLQPGVSVAIHPDVVRRDDEPPWLHKSSQGWTYLTMDPEAGVVENRILFQLPSSPEP